MRWPPAAPSCSKSASATCPTKLDRATWLNYIRCHDDIGLGFDDADIEAAGYDPTAHRRFLVDYFTGSYAGLPGPWHAFRPQRQDG